MPPLCKRPARKPVKAKAALCQCGHTKRWHILGKHECNSRNAWGRCRCLAYSPKAQTEPSLRCICGHQQPTHAGGHGVCNGNTRKYIMSEGAQCPCQHFTVERKKKGYQGL